jgi:hypothetical protein
VGRQIAAAKPNGRQLITQPATHPPRPDTMARAETVQEAHDPDPAPPAARGDLSRLDFIAGAAKINTR